MLQLFSDLVALFDHSIQTNTAEKLDILSTSMSPTHYINYNLGNSMFTEISI